MIQQITSIDKITNKNKETQSRQSILEDLMRSKTEKKRYSIMIEKTPDEIFDFLTDFENLSFISKDIFDIQETSPVKTHWNVQLKSGMTAEWDTEITTMKRSDILSWKSTSNSRFEVSGSIYFVQSPTDNRTLLLVSIIYRIPHGKLRKLVSELTEENPDSLIFNYLHRLKAYLEMGKLPAADGPAEAVLSLH